MWLVDSRARREQQDDLRTSRSQAKLFGVHLLIVPTSENRHVVTIQNRSASPIFVPMLKAYIEPGEGEEVAEAASFQDVQVDLADGYAWRLSLRENTGTKFDFIG